MLFKTLELYNNHLPPEMNLERKAKEVNHKSVVHEVINLDDATGIQLVLEQDLFVADLALQCGSLLSWVTDPTSEALAESLWKNQMRIKASEKFPDFDADEIRRLVDRDWRIMSESNRKKIVGSFRTSPTAQELKTRSENLREKLELLKTIK